MSLRLFGGGGGRICSIPCRARCFPSVDLKETVEFNYSHSSLRGISHTIAYRLRGVLHTAESLPQFFRIYRRNRTLIQSCPSLLIRGPSRFDSRKNGEKIFEDTPFKNVKNYQNEFEPAALLHYNIFWGYARFQLYYKYSRIFFIVMLSYFYMYNQIFVMISLTKYFFICSYSMLSYSFQLYI